MATYWLLHGVAIYELVELGATLVTLPWSKILAPKNTFPRPMPVISLKSVEHYRHFFLQKSTWQLHNKHNFSKTSVLS